MMLSKFSPELIDFLLEIESLGFSLCLVGGSVRDYLSQKIVSHDLDFEIRSIKSMPNEIWEEEYSKLYKFFDQKKIKYEKLAYLITRIDFQNLSLEFSSPRLEKFDNFENITHHNFTPLLSSNLDFFESFKRRDFTINAMGLVFNLKDKTETLVDPFNGIDDLKNKKLEKISDDFFLDPIRFLRLIRFKSKLQFQISDQILNNLSKFNLSEISDYHFLNEFFKSNKNIFIKDLINIVLNKRVILPARYSCWLEIDFDLNQREIRNVDELLMLTALNNLDFLLAFKIFFTQQAQEIDDLFNLFKAIKKLKKITKQDAELLIKLDLAQFQKSDWFLIMKKVNDKKKWREKIIKFDPDILSSLIFGPNNWDEVAVTEAELLAIPEKERSAYKYYLALKRWS